MKERFEYTNTDILSLDRDLLFAGAAISCVIIGLQDKKPHILLNKFNKFDKWMLPGGFIFRNEDIDDAAKRVLKIRTGLDRIYLSQFHTFGNTAPTDRDEVRDILKLHNINNLGEDHWLYDRFINIGYYALISTEKADIHPLSDEEIRWVSIDKIPPLVRFDRQIANKAIEYIGNNINNIPIDYELLPQKFTMAELRHIYEAIYGRKLDRRNFERKMLKTGYIVQLDEYEKIGKRASRLFSFSGSSKVLSNGYQ